MGSTITYRGEELHLVQGAFDDYHSLMRMRLWCHEKWGAAISNTNPNGEWDLLVAGFVFRHANCKTEFILTWL